MKYFLLLVSLGCVKAIFYDSTIGNKALPESSMFPGVCAHVLTLRRCYPPFICIDKTQVSGIAEAGR
jgi:hypothetical protein